MTRQDEAILAHTNAFSGARIPVEYVRDHIVSIISFLDYLLSSSFIKGWIQQYYNLLNLQPWLSVSGP